MPGTFYLECLAGTLFSSLEKPYYLFLLAVNNCLHTMLAIWTKSHKSKTSLWEIIASISGIHVSYQSINITLATLTAQVAYPSVVIFFTMLACNYATKRSSFIPSERN